MKIISEDHDGMVRVQCDTEKEYEKLRDFINNFNAPYSFIKMNHPIFGPMSINWTVIRKLID